MDWVRRGDSFCTSWSDFCGVPQQVRQGGKAMKFTIRSVVAVVVALSVWAPAKDNKISADELVAKHLESIGKPDERTAATVRVLEGRVTFSEIVNRNVHLEGSSTIVSQGHKFKCAFQFGIPQYSGEQLVFDGQKTMVGMIDPTSRSNLGTFLYSQEDILREGLFGGTLSHAWPLLNVAQSGATLKYEGVRKVDGHELHDVLYLPKKRGGNGDLTIHLYLDPENYRHVMTVYTVTLHNAAGNAVQGTDETEQVLEERFDDFRKTDGLMLPFHWTVRYHVTPHSRPLEYQWESTFSTARALTGN